MQRKRDRVVDWAHAHLASTGTGQEGGGGGMHALTIQH